MKGVITVPQGIITGAFNVRFDFIRELELTAADVVVETLEGDALEHTKDSFGGSGANYHILCYLPENRAGRSRISVNKEGLAVEPVEIAYDTVRTVRATWGMPIPRGAKVEIPISFSVAIENLKKRNFTLPGPFQLYGSGNSYSLIVPQRTGLTVTVSGAVRKLNGVRAEITAAAFEVTSEPVTSNQ